MDIKRMSIIICPEGVDINNVEGYDESQHGKEFSSLNEIRVNKVTDGYSVLYKDKDFGQIDTVLFGDNIIKMLVHNKCMNEIVIHYWYFDNFDESCGISIVQLDEYFEDCEESNIVYTTSQSVDYISDHYRESNQEFIWNEKYWDNIYDDDDDDEYDDLQFLRIKKKKSNKKRFTFNKKRYNGSKIMRSTKTAKRDIRRHGIIITSDKEARKRDKRVIKEFLNDFIPGKSTWIRQYREDVLDRWLDMFCIPKRLVRKLSRDCRRDDKSNRKPGRSRERAMDFARKIFEGYDPFYDPKR